MSSHDPDEDAELLDDEALIEACLGLNEPNDKRRVSRVAMPDWPAPSHGEVCLTIDPDTKRWFAANHAQWRREMALVLKAWVLAHTTAEQPADIGRH